MKSLSVLAGIVLIAYVLIGLYLYVFQRDFIYFPTVEIEHDFKTEEFLVNDEVIKAVVVNEGNKEAILYFGGNAESVAYQANTFAEIFPNHTIYLISYRGYGGSTGKPTEKGIYADALSIYDILSEKYQSVSAIGRSLGTGVVTYLGSKRDPEKIVLVTPYDSIQRIAQNKYPIYPLSILLKDKHNSIERVDDISAPALIIIANKDSVVPREHSQKLADAFPSSQATIVVFENEGHNSFSQSEKYHQALSEFIN
ncbi:MAG: alpha/beta hydrolase [Pseudomonadota bacterium]